jgi:hypothetical protein
MKKYNLLFLVLCLVPVMNFAAETEVGAACKVGEVFEGTLDPKEASVPADAIYWDFITCTYSQSECQWEANYHGFHHWKAIHDHFTCGHHGHFACYGGHH